MKRNRTESSSEDEESSSDESTNESRSQKSVLKNHLHLYKSGQMYDCTFKVGDERLNLFQEFKCHKVILGAASSVLHTTLFGSFKEATLGKDEPIFLKDCLPQVFDSAMKFIYGGEEEFDDIKNAIGVYKFSHMMDISHLNDSVDTHLQNETGSVDNVFDIFKLWLDMDKQEDDQRLKICWKEINNSPKIAFHDPSWLDLSEENICFLLQSEFNQVPEEILYWALVHWDMQTFNLLTKPCIEPVRRSSVLRLLKLIRFGSFSLEQFFRLMKKAQCLLSTEEKLQIVTSIAMQSPENLPAGFCRNMTCRNTPIFTVETPYEIQAIMQQNNVLENCSFSFSVDKPLRLVSIVLHKDVTTGLRDVGDLFGSVTISYKSSDGKNKSVPLKFGTSNRRLNVENDSICDLEANRFYTLNFVCNQGMKHRFSKVAHLKNGSEQVGRLGHFTCTFFSQIISVPVVKFFFCKIKPMMQTKNTSEPAP